MFKVLAIGRGETSYEMLEEWDMKQCDDGSQAGRGQLQVLEGTSKAFWRGEDLGRVTSGGEDGRG